MALAALLLLLWCHGMDLTFVDSGAHGAPAAQPKAAMALAAPASSQPGEAVVVCCPGGAGSTRFQATLTSPPQAALPALAVLESAALVLAPLRPVRAAPHGLLRNHDSLVALSVLIRI